MLQVLSIIVVTCVLPVWVLFVLWICYGRLVVQVENFPFTFVVMTGTVHVLVFLGGAMADELDGVASYGLCIDPGI